MGGLDDMTLGSFPCPGVFHGRQLPRYFSKGHLCSKGKLQGLAFLRTKGSHTTPLQHQGQHRLNGVITWRSHFCLLVLIPSLKKIYIVYMGKKLTFGCMPLDVQPKKEA